MNFLPPLNFKRLLAEAINDMATKGFISREQVETWLSLLRRAAERELGPADKIDAAQRDTMEGVYRRLVDTGRIVDRVPGVSKFTLSMISPRLRAELDRRIMASADLIKIRHAESIEKTLQRFSGWATSIPIGGDKNVAKVETRRDIGKSVSKYRYEVRRLNIDQGHKLTSAISHVVAMENGVIAGRWRSHWRQNHYNFRKDHKERDEHVYAVRGNWAESSGLMTKGAGYIDEMTAPAQEPYCRCYFVWITSPRKLPDSMLTRAGQAWIARGNERMMAA